MASNFLTGIRLPMIFVLLSGSCYADFPAEPLEIGTTPQFLFDQHVIDNVWAIRYKRQAVRRVFHTAVKHDVNPVMTGHQSSFLWVDRNAESGRFQMWYQANFRMRDGVLVDETQDRIPGPEPKGRKFATWIAYAESDDGVTWIKPDLKLFDWHHAKPNNIVIAWPDRPGVETCGPALLDLPAGDRKGFRYVMTYRAKGRGSSEVSGIHLIGSNDGIHWDRDSDQRIAHLHSDHHNTISYDSSRDQYVMFCRGKHIYRAFGDNMLDTGASRRVSRMHSDTLWSDWLAGHPPQTVLIPDEFDSEKHFNFFYGMPTRYRYGIYWGFLEPFRMNDFIHTELAVSRDGFDFQRFINHPTDRPSAREEVRTRRPKLIEYGDEGTWDDEMIFASPAWVEVGDEWWIYYSGWDGPHGTPDRTGAIGLAKIRREGFVSLRGPAGGGVVCTRVIQWPGGDLTVNAAAIDGVLRVRVSDEKRKPIEGFDYDDSTSFNGDNVSHVFRWGERSLDELSGQNIRLEFYLENADLYTFRAGESQ